jgi:hypothetical protein
MESMLDLKVLPENPLDTFHSRLVRKIVSFQISNLLCSARGKRNVRITTGAISGICSILNGF